MVKNSPANAGDASLIPGSGRAPGEGNGNPLQYFLLGKSHGQRSLEDYSPCSYKRVGHDLGTKTTATILHWHFHESTQCDEIASVNVYAQGFPGDAGVKEPTCKCRRYKRHWVPSWGQKDPQEKGTETQTNILAWRIPWAGAWWTTVHRVAKSWTRLKRLIMRTCICTLRYTCIVKSIM